MAVELPTNAFETIREVGQVASWLAPLITGASIGGPIGLAWVGIKLASWCWGGKRTEGEVVPAQSQRSVASTFQVTGPLPSLPRDYSACYSNHVAMSGGNPANVVKEFDAYVRAFQLLQVGTLMNSDVTADQQQTIAMKMRQWIYRSFAERHLQESPDPSNTQHKVFLGYLYKRAVELLADGQFGTHFNALSLADSVRDYIAARLVDSVTATLNES